MKITGTGTHVFRRNLPLVAAFPSNGYASGITNNQAPSTRETPITNGFLKPWVLVFSYWDFAGSSNAPGDYEK